MNTLVFAVTTGKSIETREDRQQVASNAAEAG